jgi:hypothetical protein
MLTREDISRDVIETRLKYLYSTSQLHICGYEGLWGGRHGLKNITVTNGFLNKNKNKTEDKPFEPYELTGKSSYTCILLT